MSPNHSPQSKMLDEELLVTDTELYTPILTPDRPASPVDDHGDDEAWLDFNVPIDDQPLWALHSRIEDLQIQDLKGYYSLDPTTFDDLASTPYTRSEETDIYLTATEPSQKSIEAVVYGPATFKLEQNEVVHVKYQGITAPAWPVGTIETSRSPEAAVAIIAETFLEHDDMKVELSVDDTDNDSLNTEPSAITIDFPDLRTAGKSLLSRNPWEVTAAFKDFAGKSHNIPMMLDTGCGCNLISQHFVDSLGHTERVKKVESACITSLSDDPVEYNGIVEMQWSWPGSVIQTPITSLFFVVPNNNFAITMPILGGADIKSNDILVFNIKVFGGSLYEPSHRYTNVKREKNQPSEISSNRASHERVTRDFDAMTKAYQAEKKRGHTSSQPRGK